jgi:hypothetical protein
MAGRKAGERRFCCARRRPTRWKDIVVAVGEWRAEMVTGVADEHHMRFEVRFAGARRQLDAGWEGYPRTLQVTSASFVYYNQSQMFNR